MITKCKVIVTVTLHLLGIWKNKYDCQTSNIYVIIDVKKNMVVKLKLFLICSGLLDLCRKMNFCQTRTTEVVTDMKEKMWLSNGKYL